jgi:hypothetical protein
MKNLQKEFNEKCTSLLPEYIRIDGVDYKRVFDNLMGDGYQLMYIEFDGENFNFSNQIFRGGYSVVKSEDIPVKPIEYKGGLVDGTIYVTSIDEIILDCLTKLEALEYEKLEEVVTKETKFNRELISLLNRYSKENGSNTPDFILANYLNSCLHTFNNTINQREKFFGRNIAESEIMEVDYEN